MLRSTKPAASRSSVGSPLWQLCRALAPTAALLWLALTTALMLTGCGPSRPNNTAANGPQKTKIVVTTGMVRDMVQAIAGEHAEVEGIMGPGVDPHLYEPTRSDAIKMRDADIVVYGGLHLEGKLGDLLERRNSDESPSISVGDLLPVDRLITVEAGLHDPHIWMDASLWADATLLLGDKLAEVMSDHAEEVRENASAYHDRVMKVHEQGVAAIKSIPESQRVLITAHDAFSYFGQRYGMEVFAPQGISTASEPSIADINRLVKLIVSRKVPAIFFESSVSPRAVESIIEGAKQASVEISSDRELFSDSLGRDDGPAGNYIGMMTHNFTEIAEGLGGHFPSDEPPATESAEEPAATESAEESPAAESAKEPAAAESAKEATAKQDSSEDELSLTGAQR